MSILTKVEQDLKKALKARDEFLVSTLKFLLAQIRNREIELRAAKKKLTDQVVVGIIRQEIKKRIQAAGFYRQGKRGDLADKEESESRVLSKYLPQQISTEELGKIVQETVAQIGAKGLVKGRAGPADFGKVMGAVMARIKGRADGSQVAAIVKKALNS